MFFITSQQSRDDAREIGEPLSLSDKTVETINAYPLPELMDTRERSSAFGHNTANTTLQGVSLPVATLDDLCLCAHRAAEIGIPHIEIHGTPMVPSVRSAITSGKTQVKVVNAADVAVTCRICDIGPGIRTLNAIDLTYVTAHALDTQGDAVVAFQVLV
jgi:hypothetical protein